MLSVAIESNRRGERRRRINAGDFRGKGEICHGFGDLLSLPRFSSCQIDRRPFCPAWLGQNPPQLEHLFIISTVRLRRRAEIVGIGEWRTCGVEAIRKGREV